MEPGDLSEEQVRELRRLARVVARSLRVPPAHQQDDEAEAVLGVLMYISRHGEMPPEGLTATVMRRRVIDRIRQRVRSVDPERPYPHTLAYDPWPDIDDHLAT